VGPIFVRDRIIRDPRRTRAPVHRSASLQALFLLRTDVSDECIASIVRVISSSEKSVLTRATWRHIPEDGILHSHRSENLIYHIAALPTALLNWAVSFAILLSPQIQKNWNSSIRSLKPSFKRPAPFQIRLQLCLPFREIKIRISHVRRGTVPYTCLP
jgi:hypothetical protein